MKALSLSLLLTVACCAAADSLPLNNGPKPPVSFSWNTTFGFDNVVPVVDGDGHVYILESASNWSCFDPLSGHVLWTLNASMCGGLGNPIFGSGLAIFTGNGASDFVALQPATGDVVWSTSCDSIGPYYNQIVLSHGMLAVAWNAGVGLLDPSTGYVVWTNAVTGLRNQFTGAALFVDSTSVYFVYMSVWNNGVNMLRMSELGELVWNVTLPSYQTSRFPQLSGSWLVGDRLCTSYVKYTGAQCFICADTASGELVVDVLLPNATDPNGNSINLLMGATNLYYWFSSGSATAVRLIDGVGVWTYPGTVLAELGGVTILRDWATLNITALSASFGTPLWSVFTASLAPSKIVFDASSGLAYLALWSVVNDSASVWCFDVKSGVLSWTEAIPSNSWSYPGPIPFVGGGAAFVSYNKVLSAFT